MCAVLCCCALRKGDRAQPRLTFKALAALAVSGCLLLSTDFSAASGPSITVSARAGAAARADRHPAAAHAPACAPTLTACVDACGELLHFIREQRNASSWHDYYEEIALFLIASGVAQGTPATLVEVGTAFGGEVLRTISSDASRCCGGLPSTRFCHPTRVTSSRSSSSVRR